MVITLIVSLSLNLTALGTAMTRGIFPEAASIFLALSILFSFVLLPKLLYKKLLNFETKTKIGWKTGIVFVGLFLLLMHRAEGSMVLHFLGIGIGEEYLFRKLHYD